MGRVAIRLPDEVVKEVDRLVHRGAFATRTAAVRAGLDRLLADERRRRLDERLLKGYRRRPAPSATASDHAATDGLIDEEPW